MSGTSMWEDSCDKPSHYIEIYVVHKDYNLWQPEEAHMWGMRYALRLHEGVNTGTLWISGVADWYALTSVFEEKTSYEITLTLIAMTCFVWLWRCIHLCKWGSLSYIVCALLHIWKVKLWKIGKFSCMGFICIPFFPDTFFCLNFLNKSQFLYTPINLQSLTSQRSKSYGSKLINYNYHLIVNTTMCSIATAKSK